MVNLDESNIRHLLRRTEFVDRPERVIELLGAGSIDAAVDNILNVDPNPPSVTLRSTDQNWEQARHYTHFWLDRMASQSARPFQERMSLFWHGHFCSSVFKVGPMSLMRQQVDLFRASGLGSFSDLAKAGSVQVAMLRYLDNRFNTAASPNQNFARELMELFLLGVGNYNEADVEASTAAWSGHTEHETNMTYVFRPDLHDGTPHSFLGQPLSSGSNASADGFRTIEIMLGAGAVPPDANNHHNRGRPSREVAAEFLSHKLWLNFANEAPSGEVIALMRTAFINSDFNIRSWVRSMLSSDEFYSDAVKQGLVRSPTEWMVAMLYSTAVPSKDVTPVGRMLRMGQHLLYPPNVDGWKTNAVWVNSSAMEERARSAASFAWRATQDYWKSDYSGYIQLRGGQITQAEVIARKSNGDPALSSSDLVDRLADYANIRLAQSSRAQIIAHAEAGPLYARHEALFLMYVAPEVHLS